MTLLLSLFGDLIWLKKVNLSIRLTKGWVVIVNFMSTSLGHRVPRYLAKHYF